MSERLGLMGGTFDPIHNGHLMAAAGVAGAMDLDRVLFLPAGDPYRKRDVTDSRHRQAMVELALAPHPTFELSAIEMERDGPSYTVDTLRQLAGDGVELTCILGIDALRDLGTWKDPEACLALATFVGVSRPGFPSDIPPTIAERVTVLDVDALDISSTDIRRRVREGSSIEDLVPSPVATYIVEHGLYA